MTVSSEAGWVVRLPSADRNISARKASSYRILVKLCKVAQEDTLQTPRTLPRRKNRETDKSLQQKLLSHVHSVLELGLDNIGCTVRLV